MKPQTLKFVFEKETKSTFRYQEEAINGTTPVVGYIYVSKEQATIEPPKELIVTITPVTA